MQSVIVECLKCNKNFDSALPKHVQNSANHLLYVHDAECPLCGSSGKLNVVNLLSAQLQ